MADARQTDRTRETALWNWLKAGLKGLGRRSHAHRVENGVETGCPDVEACLGGVCLWCELKVAERFTKKGTFEVRMKSGQAYWAHERVRALGLSWVLVRLGSEHFLLWGGDALDFYLKWAEGTPDRLTGLTRADLVAVSHCAPKASAAELWDTMSRRPAMAERGQTMEL